MLSPTVIGVVLHLLGLKSNFGQVEVWTSTGPKLDFIGVARGDPPQTPIKSIEAKLAEMDLTEVARGGPALTPLKATESKSKFNEAQVQVQQGAAELNLDLDEVALS